MKLLARWMTQALVPLCVAGYALAYDEPARTSPHGAELYIGGSLASEDLLLPSSRGIVLSDAQQERLYEIFNTQSLVLFRQAKVVERAQDEMRKLAMSSSYSDAKARALAEVVARATAEMTLQLSRSDHLIFEMLTPEQRKQATAAMRLTTATPPSEHMLTVFRN